jgi:hypothetical protein
MYNKITYQSQIELLQQQINLQEANYKYAIELEKGINIQIYLREYIKKLKEDLLRLQNANTDMYFNTAILPEECWRNN